MTDGRIPNPLFSHELFVVINFYSACRTGVAVTNSILLPDAPELSSQCDRNTRPVLVDDKINVDRVCAASPSDCGLGRLAAIFRGNVC